MATYLTGSNKYIPQIQPYQPDLNFYKTVLDTKTAQYEAGYDRVNSIYGTLLNSALTRQDTSTMRNDFFSKANNEIQRLAGVDLSLEDNQTAAFQVFKPLTTNKLFAKDVNFTKDLYNEYDRSEFFRNCLNEKDCGGKYWQGGVDYLQYKAQDFAEADEKTAMAMESPKYVPFVNTVADAVDFALKSKLEMQTVTSDGRYLYTTTNGTPMEAPLHSYFIAKYGNDQRAADMYNVSAYLQRKNYGQQKAAEFGSTQAAEADYIQQIISAADKANREYKKQAEQNKETVNAKKGVVEDYIKNKGVDPEMDKDLIEYYNRLNDDTDAAEAADSYYKESLDISSPSSLEGISQTALAARADAILARNLLDSDMATAAHSYATMTQKQDVKADPIYLENLNFSHQVSLESYKNQNAMQKANWDYANDLEKMLIKSRLDTDVSIGAAEKALGFLSGILGKVKDNVTPTNTDKSGSGNSTGDAYDSDDEGKKKSPEQLKYEAELHNNSLKQKEQRENELELKIHQLRGHNSDQIWKEMGKDKLSTIGLGERSDLSFVDTQENQLLYAKNLFDAYQKGATLTEKEKVLAGAYSMGWGTDVEGYAATGYQKIGPYKNAYSDAKPAAETQESAEATAAANTGAASSNTGTTSTNTGEATAQSSGGQGPIVVPNTASKPDSATASVDSTAVNPNTAVVTPDSTSVASIDSSGITNGLREKVDEYKKQDSIANGASFLEVLANNFKALGQSAQQRVGSGDGSILKVDSNRNDFMAANPVLAKAGIGSVEELQQLQEFAQKPFQDQMADPNFTRLFSSLQSLEADAKTEVMVDAAESVSRMMGGPENFSQEFEDYIRNNTRSYLGGSIAEEKSVIGAMMAYSITDLSKAETTASRIDPKSTEEFKNIQLPKEKGGFLETLFSNGLGLMANKIEYKNAITAGMDPELNDVVHFKNLAVKTIVGKYQDKIRSGNANEKKSALASLKKIFPKYAAMKLIGDNGDIKSPVASVSLPLEDQYDNALNEFDKDPLFRDDTETKGKIVDAATTVNIALQDLDARLKVDRYNIGQVYNKMLTNQGLMGTGDDLASFMDKYLFKDMGTISSPNNSADNSPLKAVVKREDFMKDMYSNEKTWAAADIIADAAIVSSEYYNEVGNQAAQATVSGGYTPTGTYGDVVDQFNKLNKLNPAISKRLADKGNKLLGKESWSFIDELWNNDTKLSEKPQDVYSTVNRLNMRGLNGKELLKEAIMETWTSEGRTTEWQVYQDYVNTEQKRGKQAPYLEFGGVPVIGYDKFTKEYGTAAADLNANLQTYAPKNIIGDAYSGQGGRIALPYGINFNEGLDLAVGVGNQDMIGLVDNLNEVLNSDTDRKKPFNQRAYVLDMPYNNVVKEVDMSDEPIEDWDWDNSAGNLIENIFGGTLESKHKSASVNTNNLMNQIAADLKGQANVNQFNKLDLLQGSIKTYPIAVGTNDMTAYEITLNGNYAKSRGFQKGNEDKIFTVLIPTYKAKNNLYKRATATSWVDLALWANGKAVIDVPNSGSITITQDNMDNYVMAGQMYLPDSLGNVSLQQLAPQVSSKSTIPGWLFADQIKMQLLGNHKDLMQLNLNTRANRPLVKNLDEVRNQ
jgi:hypothetical protein